MFKFVMWLFHEDRPETRTNFDFIFQIVLYQGLWYSLWRLLSHFYGDKLSRNTIGRVFSLFFGVWISLFATANYFGEGRKGGAARNTWSENTNLSRVLSFLVADLVIQLTHDVYNHFYIGHHVLSFIAVASALITDKGASVVFTGILVTEFVNIFNNLKGVLEDLELVSSQLYFYVEGLYIGLFILSRSIFGPLYLYCVLGSFRELPVPLLPCLVLLAAISYLAVPQVRDSALVWWTTFSDAHLKQLFSTPTEAAAAADGQRQDGARSETASQAGALSRGGQSRGAQSRNRSEAVRSRQGTAQTQQHEVARSPSKSRHGSVHRLETNPTAAAVRTPRAED